MLILPLSLGPRAIPEAWVGSHGQGPFEVVLSEHMDFFFSKLDWKINVKRYIFLFEVCRSNNN